MMPVIAGSHAVIRIATANPKRIMSFFIVIVFRSYTNIIKNIADAYYKHRLF